MYGLADYETGGAARRIDLPDVGSETGPGRRFLFVTAPFGPFSSALAARLREQGATCRRVLLNGGDLLDWGVRDAVLFRGDAVGWPAWIRRHLASEGVTDLVTHGDGQSYGMEAIAAARALGITVHVFEQGYFRPHWITLERNGVNAHSSLPTEPEAYLSISALPEPPPTPVGKITPAAVLRISAYHLASYAGWIAFPRFRHNYAHGAWRQCAGHTGRYVVQRLLRPLRRAALGRFLAPEGPVFMALMQRPGDSQLTRHSAYPEAADFITRVIDSFAAHAEPGVRLLFKSHPLDHGLQAHSRRVAEAARRAGVEDRVYFADDGHLPTLIARACGVVTVNSTGGLSSIEAGLPTLVLGKAIYDMAGLTHRGGLDSFWRSPERPDPNLYARYRAVVMASCQINGAFSTRHGVALSTPEACRRLLEARA